MVVDVVLIVILIHEFFVASSTIKNSNQYQRRQTMSKGNVVGISFLR